MRKFSIIVINCMFSCVLMFECIMKCACAIKHTQLTDCSKVKHYLLLLEENNCNYTASVFVFVYLYLHLYLYIIVSTGRSIHHQNWSLSKAAAIILARKLLNWIMIHWPECTNNVISLPFKLATSFQWRQLNSDWLLVRRFVCRDIAANKCNADRIACHL